MNADRQAAAVALAATGFSAVIGQIVLMRELIVVFNGNEISLGIMLAVWLFWTATGSGVASALRLGTKHPRGATAALECLLAASLAPTVWALRASKAHFQTVPGEMVGPLPMLLATLGCMSLFCVIAGALFVVAARFFASDRSAAGPAYLLEALGSALGGVLASAVLLGRFGSFQIVFLVGLLNLCMAAVLSLRLRRRWIFVVAAIAALISIPLLATLAPRLDRQSRERLWNGLDLIASRDTIYGNLAVTDAGGVRSLYADGTNVANAPDPASAEEAVHYALLEHPAPRRVLLIGGGVNGAIGEALKHPTVTRLDYVELDPALIDLTRSYFPAEAAALADPRVHVHLADGRLFLKAAPDRFDAILVDVPDPQTAQLNRFYTAEFFRTARGHLAPGGIVAIALRSSEETLSPDLEAFLRSIRRTLESEFPQVVAIPGETIHFIASDRAGVLTADPRVLLQRRADRRLDTEYVSQYFIPYRMSPDRMAQAESELRPLASTPVNRDFAPAAYYFNVVLWSAQFGSSYADRLRSAAAIPFRSVMGVLASALLGVVFLAIFMPRSERRVRTAAILCTAATGLTLMTLQIFLLLGFESIYGYVYQRLAVLIGLFMAGMALGSWFGMRRGTGRASLRSMATAQLVLALAGPMLLLAMEWLGAQSGAAASWIAVQLAFPLLAALAGLLGGRQFVTAASVFLAGDRRGLGLIYAVDLLGGCVGALVLSTYLVPVFGFAKTAWLVAIVNAAAVLVALRSWAEAERGLTCRVR